MNFPFASTTLGIVEFLIEQVIGILTSLANAVIDMVITYFSKLLYSVAIAFFQIADFAQMFFRRMAGMDVHWYEGVQTTGDPLMTLISNESVLEVMVALGIVAFTMLMLATIVQIIRVQYTTEGAKNTVGNIVGQSLKSLAMFLLVPVASFMGIFVSNQLLMAVDGATNQSGSTYISGAIFVASASEANRVRKSGEGLGGTLDAIFNFLVFPSAIITVDDQGNIQQPGATNDGATDEAYKFVHTGTATENRQVIAEKIDYAFANKLQNNNSNFLYKNPVMGYHFDYNNIFMVNAYYMLGEINYIVLFAAAGLSIWALYNAAFGLIMRLYKGAFLFIISPPIVAVMPLDGGGGFKQWRGLFLGAVIGAYGVVLSLNLFFLLLPILKKIQLFDPNATAFGIDTGNEMANSFLATNYYYNNFVYLLFVVVGCYMFKNLSKMIASIFNAEDVLDTGSEMSGKAVGMATKIAMGVATGGASLVGGLSSYGGMKENAKQSKAYMADAETKLANKDFAGAKKSFAKAQLYENLANKDSEKFNNNALYQMGKRGVNAVTGGIGLGPDVYGRGKNTIKNYKDFNNRGKDLEQKLSDIDNDKKPKLPFEKRLAQEEANANATKEGRVKAIQELKQQDPEFANIATANVESSRINVGSLLDKFESSKDENDKSKLLGEIKEALSGTGLDSERGNDLLEKMNINLGKLVELRKEVDTAKASGNTGLADSKEKEFNNLSATIPTDSSALRKYVNDQAGEVTNFITNPTSNVDVSVLNSASSVADKMGGMYTKVIGEQVKKSVEEANSKLQTKYDKQSEIESLSKAISSALKPTLNEINKNAKDAVKEAKDAKTAAKKAGAKK